MKSLCIIFLFLASQAQADIFTKPAENRPLEKAIASDWKNFYYKTGLSYNVQEDSDPAYEFNKNTIPLGKNRFDLHENLKAYMLRSEFDNELDWQQLTTTLSASRLLLLQYSSPVLADLYKHMESTGHLRLGIRYQQYQDLERAVNEPLVVLRKQAIMDCIRRRGLLKEDLDNTLKACFDGKDQNAYENLETPGDGQELISGTHNLTSETLNRINTEKTDLEAVNDVLPHVHVSSNLVTVRGPRYKSRELMSVYRQDLTDKLKSLLERIKNGQTSDPQALAEVSVAGVPLSENLLRSVAMLHNSSQEIALDQLASQLAYLKVINSYVKAAGMLQRVMNHPAIQPGYKNLLKGSVEYVDREIALLKEEKERLGDYYRNVQGILGEADRERMSVISTINQESQSKQKKGIFNLIHEQ